MINEHGYYMTKRSEAQNETDEGGERIGWSGDFYTAPDVHPLIAKAIFNQVREVDDLLHRPTTLTVVEMGGGKGLLARDFLRECEKVVTRFEVETPLRVRGMQPGHACLSRNASSGVCSQRLVGSMDCLSF